MKWLNRDPELTRLRELLQRRAGALCVLYGRRRIGKTRLLVEWSTEHDGVYTVADQSAPDIQRRYLASALAERLEGFADVEYPDWTALLSRLAREARSAKWRGPIVFDEFPYLVNSSPELPSVMQRWLDHDAKAANLVVAIAGSSQRMMQGLVLSANAPLYGRAKAILQLEPLSAGYIPEAFRVRKASETIAEYAAWGGVPRYWELAAELAGATPDRVDKLVLDPSGPLHREPDRLLLEELPPAMELRPILDAIGAGAHRVSEIAGRLGRPATSLSRPLDRLQGLGLVTREVPFGEAERKSKRSLYKISDPFFRLWFRVVAPHRALLAAGSKAERKRVLARHWPGLVATTWEGLCRSAVPKLSSRSSLGPWGVAKRWWRGNEPEWDIVGESLDERALLLGEVKWSPKPMTRRALDAALGELLARPAPSLAGKYIDVRRVLFVPEGGDGGARDAGLRVIGGKEVLAALKA